MYVSIYSKYPNDLYTLHHIVMLNGNKLKEVRLFNYWIWLKGGFWLVGSCSRLEELEVHGKFVGVSTTIKGELGQPRLRFPGSLLLRVHG